MLWGRQDQEVTINDAVRGEVTWNTNTLGDFVILRSNGQPVYNFCVAVDDATMAISHVLRAEEHLPNTLRQARACSLPHVAPAPTPLLRCGRAGRLPPHWRCACNSSWRAAFRVLVPRRSRQPARCGLAGGPPPGLISP